MELDEVSDNEEINIEEEDDSNLMNTMQLPKSQPQTPQALTPQPTIQQTPTSQAPTSRKRRRGEKNDNMISECLNIS